MRTLLQNTASLGVFWLFVGFGRGRLAFYKNLNALASATFTNVASYDAGKNPGAVPGERFYTSLVAAFAAFQRSPHRPSVDDPAVVRGGLPPCTSSRRPSAEVGFFEAPGG
ncbi:hypothetical protein [Streptomyces sp. NPDC005548]|uniref:hypothetical protein n=1 Tax=Streptomyces sp. NPDC005548 TaxID=3364724 RepID=UPI0036B95634